MATRKSSEARQSWWGDRWSKERFSTNYPSPELIAYLGQYPNEYFEERFLARAVTAGLLPKDIHIRFWLAASLGNPIEDNHILQVVGLADVEPHPLLAEDIELPETLILHKSPYEGQYTQHPALADMPYVCTADFYEANMDFNIRLKKALVRRAFHQALNAVNPELGEEATSIRDSKSERHVSPGNSKYARYTRFLSTILIRIDTLQEVYEKLVESDETGERPYLDRFGPGSKNRQILRAVVLDDIAMYVDEEHAS